MATGTNGNGVKTWIVLVQQLGLPTVFLGVVSWVLVTQFIQPMSAHQDKLINANIESQSKLTQSVDAMAMSLQEAHAFQEGVQGPHQEQCKTLEDIRSIMDEAKTQMADVPAKRDEQIKLLTEIRDKLDVPN